MNATFAGLLWKKCLIYMDDLLIFSKTFSEHIENLQLCLDRCRERNLKLKPTKCKLFQHEIDFLGYWITGDRMHTQEKKIKAIAIIVVPDTAKATHTFVCLAGFYRRFIKNFAEISRPLHQAVHVDKFLWMIS